MTNEEIQGLFFQECDEGLAAAEAALMACRTGGHDGETINQIFRAVHSIKGGAGAFGFSALQSFTHHFETVLDLVRGGDLALSDDVLTLMFRAFDRLADHVAATRARLAPPDDGEILALLRAAGSPAPSQPVLAVSAAPCGAADVTGLSFDLDALLGDLERDSPTNTPSQPWLVRFRPGPGALRHGHEPLLLLRELAALGGELLSVDHADIPALGALDPRGAYLGWTFRLPADVPRAAIAEIFEFVAGECDLAIERADAAALPAPAPAAHVVSLPPVRPKAAASFAAPQTIRVDLDKLDRLVDLIGALGLAQTRLGLRLGGEGLAGIAEMADLDRLARDLQHSAQAIRTQPVEAVFSRVHRIVRELEAQTGKRIRLEVEGEDIELDRTVIERIGEPLTHLIRNSVDHGIELPADRVAVGKPAEGVVRLAAVHGEGEVLITVEDDGRGIDRDHVRALAVDRGLVPADARLSEEEVDELIFVPGFSTARALSSISGRGVGMDVVRQNVRALGGRVVIRSRPGQGTAFTLALPLPRAVAPPFQGLMAPPPILHRAHG